MELFILAAVSLTIAVSLLLKKEKDAVQLSFALVCLALFLQKGGSFINGIFEDPAWRVMSLAGLLFLPPFSLSLRATCSAARPSCPGKRSLPWRC
jgi:hypothetical protein